MDLLQYFENVSLLERIAKLLDTTVISKGGIALMHKGGEDAYLWDKDMHSLCEVVEYCNQLWSEM